MEAPQETGDELPAGTTLLHGQYKIVDFLNAGGFGITYRAVDSLDRKVVIKECFPGAFCRRSRQIVQPRSRAHRSEFDGIVRLFVQEARSLSKLQHPNIVGVHQVFEENDTAYMALDFVEGRDLLDIVEDPAAGLTPEQIVGVLDDMLDAVRFVHAQDMLHRDISPDNILMDPTGRPVLIDFGAARQQATKESRVMSAMRVVKDGYSPQEFYITGAEQGPYSDLYALGATFHHLIAGEVPPDSQRRLTAIATGEPDPYRPLAGRFPAYDDAVLASIDRSVAILPKDRFQTADEWLEAVNGEAPEPAPRVVSRPLSRRLSRRMTRPAESASAPAAPKKRGKGLLVAGVAAIALAAAGGFVLLQDPSAQLAALGVLSEDGPATSPEGIDETAFAAGPEADAAAPVAEDPETPIVVAGAVSVVEPDGSLRPAPRPEREAAARPVPQPTPGIGPDPADAPELALPERAAPEERVAAALPPSEDGVEARGWTDFLPIVGTAPGAEFVPYAPLEARWTLALPYDDLRVDAQGRSWVVSVDGVPVADRAEFDALVSGAHDLAAIETLDIEMGIGPRGAAPSFVQSATLAAVYDVSVPDGPTFRALREDGTWITRVVDLGSGVETDLEVGDVVLGSMETGVPFSGPRGLADKLETAISAGGRTLGFAVNRDGSTWVASLTLPRTPAR
jgi:serine/threonine protein kinase